MISAIVPTRDSARELQSLLSALVPAAVEGLVREVVVADAGSTDITDVICDDAGARLLQGGVSAAAKAAKSDWLLVLPVDLRLARGWHEAVADHLKDGGGEALILGVGAARGWLQRFKPPAQSAMLVRKETVTEAGRELDLAGVRAKLARATRLG